MERVDEADSGRPVGTSGWTRRAMLTAGALSLLAASVMLGPATGVAAGPASDAVGNRAVEVIITQHAFSPETVTVPAGTTITWVNRDEDLHTATSTTGTFTSRGLDTDERFSFTLTTPGTYAYMCSLHPQMRGRIIVQ